MIGKRFSSSFGQTQKVKYEHNGTRIRHNVKEDPEAINALKNASLMTLDFTDKL